MQEHIEAVKFGGEWRYFPKKIGMINVHFVRVLLAE